MSGQFINEAEVLKSCLAGDKGAFEAIVKKYQSLICAITYSATMDVEKSEELAHQVFINAWKNLKSLNDIGKFKGWICTIARNVVYNFIRSQKRDLIKKAESIEQTGDISSTADEPYEELADKEQQVIMNFALERIPIKYREPLVLFYREQKSTREVATQLGIGEDIVRTRIFRGKKMLKDQVVGIIEGALKRTKPGPAFTAIVMGSIIALTLKSTTATAAGAAVTSGGAKVGVGTVLSSAAAKITAVAAAVIITTGAVLVYNHIKKQNSMLSPSNVQNEQMLDPMAVKDSGLEAGSGQSGQQGENEGEITQWSRRG